MGISVVNVQRDIILDAIRNTARGEWKVLVIDEAAKKLIDNVIKEDDILNENITNIEQIEQRRQVNKDMDAVYLLSPLPHIVDCLMADFQRRRYRRSHLVWIALLEPQDRRRIDSSQSAREQIGEYKTLSVDFFPRESHLVTFRDPWSFPVLFHPACNNLVRGHMHDLTKKVCPFIESWRIGLCPANLLLLTPKIVSLCISLGENPVIRYYRPRNPSHEASVLCSHIARFVQEELDAYAEYHTDFPPPSNRPRGALFIADRSMDLYSPLIHEFTYQAMAHDLLPIKEGEKVVYKTVIKQGEPGEEEKDLEIGEKDKIWVENRHRHMKDTIEKLMEDFQKFIDENPHFTNSADANSLNAIKDMLAGLPQFQELKEAYSLHLNMAQECMNIFQNHKLPDLASVEQTLATGLDEDYRKPKNLADDVVRLLDDESIVPADRLRFIMLYILYRDGLLPADTHKLLAHAQLRPQDEEVIQNLELLGARVQKPLKDNKPPPQPLFGKKQAPAPAAEGYALSRFEPSLKLMLDCHVKGTLDQAVFPFTKPQLDAPPEGLSGLESQSQASLRSAKPTWARGRLSTIEPRQRIIVFMAGGATYAESRSCYEISKSSSRDVFLATSHMTTPSLFIRQVGDLSVDKRRLDIPAERPKPRAPQYLFEPEPKPKPPPPMTPAARPSPHPLAPPTNAMGSMTLSSAPNGGQSGNIPTAPPKGSMLKNKEKQDKKDKKDDKKKHHFFSHKRKE